MNKGNKRDCELVVGYFDGDSDDDDEGGKIKRKNVRRKETYAILFKHFLYIYHFKKIHFMFTIQKMA